jgi:hypothetical protein
MAIASGSTALLTGDTTTVEVSARQNRFKSAGYSLFSVGGGGKEEA